jgi:prepilin-type N-terminal cleavage/methylation domain-containing protein
METPQHHSSTSGFSLIELSIVLVIIGLLVGGVLVGRDVLFAAKQRAVVSEKEQLVASVQTFRLKYGGLPGDLPNATSFWGGQADCNQVNTTPREETCNGDGNGKVGSLNVSDGFSTTHETFWFWQQLANAGLWAGKYSGATFSEANWQRRAEIGVNVPGSKADGKLALYVEHTVAPINVNWWFAGQYGNVLQVGGIYSPGIATAGVFAYPWMTAQQAKAFDEKFDDGKPGTGNIRVNSGVSDGYCAIDWSGMGTDSDQATHHTSLSGVNCNVLFPNLF